MNLLDHGCTTASLESQANSSLQTSMFRTGTAQVYDMCTLKAKENSTSVDNSTFCHQPRGWRGIKRKVLRPSSLFVSLRFETGCPQICSLRLVRSLHLEGGLTIYNPFKGKSHQLYKSILIKWQLFWVKCMQNVFSTLMMSPGFSHVWFLQWCLKKWSAHIGRCEAAWLKQRTGSTTWGASCTMPLEASTCDGTSCVEEICW